MKECYIQINRIGPNVIISCSCGQFHQVKRKGNESEAIRLARAHAAERKNDKWANFKGPTAEEVYKQRQLTLARYRKANPRPKQEDNHYMEHHIRMGS